MSTCHLLCINLLAYSYSLLLTLVTHRGGKSESSACYTPRSAARRGGRSSALALAPTAMAIAVLAALACGFTLPDVLTQPVIRSRAFSARHAVVLAAGKPAGAGRRVARRQVASNKIARRNFEILQELEAGISLYGTEVKSCRAGRIQLRAAACDERSAC